MAEPTYIAQTAEPMTREELRAWLRARSTEAYAGGAGIVRATASEDGRMFLLEGWADRRAKQGEPRWQLSAPGAQT